MQKKKKKKKEFPQKTLHEPGLAYQNGLASTACSLTNATFSAVKRTHAGRLC